MIVSEAPKNRWGLGWLGCACKEGLGDDSNPAIYGPVNGQYVTLSTFLQWQKDETARNQANQAALIAEAQRRVAASTPTSPAQPISNKDITAIVKAVTPIASVPVSSPTVPVTNQGIIPIIGNTPVSPPWTNPCPIGFEQLVQVDGSKNCVLNPPGGSGNTVLVSGQSVASQIQQIQQPSGINNVPVPMMSDSNWLMSDSLLGGFGVAIPNWGVLVIAGTGLFLVIRGKGR